MRVLVTGGTGFIGRRLMKFLLTDSVADPLSLSCFVLPATTPGEGELIAQWRGRGVQIIEGDLDQPRISAQAAPAVDLVFHLAARTSTKLTDQEVRVNDEGTERLLAWLAATSQDWRFVHASTSGAVDRNGPAAGPLTEESPCYPFTPYGCSKLRAEHVVKRRAAGMAFTYTMFRFPTVYGPGQMKRGLFDRLTESAASGSWLARINWPGKTSVLFVDDLVRLMWDVGRMPESANQLYCVASDEALSVGEIARAVGRGTGHPVRPIDLPAWMWSIARWLAWNRLARAIMPSFARIPFWQFRLMVDHGFWFDTSKLRRIYRAPLLEVEPAVRRTMEILQEENPPGAVIVPATQG